MQRALPLLVLSALALGCPAPSGSGDAGDSGAVDAGNGVIDGCLSLPAPPEAPRLTDWTCPPGWEQIDTHAVTATELANGYAPATKACAPPALPATCPPGQRPALGASTCVQVGDACPAGDFPPAPAGTVLYVRTGGTGNGSSPSSPLGTITAALAAASAGTTIAIAKGNYVETLPVIRAVTLLGACAEQTIVTAPNRSATRGTIDVGAAATIKNLTVTGPRPGIWVSFNTDFARLEGVVVKGAELVGVFVSDNGKAQLDGVLIQDTLPDPADNTMGRGLQVRSGGQVRGSGVVVERSRDVGVTLDGAGIVLELAELIVRDTQSETASRAYGLGMEVRYGARATLTRALLEKNRNSGLVTDQPGSRVSLTDVVIQDTLPQENNNQYGGGFEAAPGTTVDFTRVLIRRNRATGMRLGGAAFTAKDLAVTDTAGRANDSAQGLGLVMDRQATAQLDRAVFANNRVADFLVADLGTRVTVNDARLYGARSQASDGRWGVGFFVIGQGVLIANRLAVEHTDDAGGHAQTRAVLSLTDLSIRDTGKAAAGVAGDGLSVQSGANATIIRAAFKANRRIAAGAFGSSVLTLIDVQVSDVGADSAGYFGRGIGAELGAQVSVQRAHVVRAREGGVYAIGAGTNLTLDQVSVFETLAAPGTARIGRALDVENAALVTASCFWARGSSEVAANVTGFNARLFLSRARLVETGGPAAFGNGLTATNEATAVVEDSEIEGNQNLGMAFAFGARGIIRRTRIISNAIGLYTGEGSVAREVTEAMAISAGEVQLEPSCTFEGNRARISSDFVPLPEAIGGGTQRPEY